MFVILMIHVTLTNILILFDWLDQIFSTFFGFFTTGSNIDCSQNNLVSFVKIFPAQLCSIFSIFLIADQLRIATVNFDWFQQLESIMTHETCDWKSFLRCSHESYRKNIPHIFTRLFAHFGPPTHHQWSSIKILHSQFEGVAYDW